MKFVTGELQGLRKVIEYLWDGEQEAFNALYFIKSNYKEWPEIFHWFKTNKLVGTKLVELFQNESPDGGGYHLGVEMVVSRIRGAKAQVNALNVDDLLL
tara:strand:+ start:344 stop:640 length:297 start_codon:yes stop_codon:yes gene_type:complete